MQVEVQDMSSNGTFILDADAADDQLPVRLRKNEVTPVQVGRRLQFGTQRLLPGADGELLARCAFSAILCTGLPFEACAVCSTASSSQELQKHGCMCQCEPIHSVSSLNDALQCKVSVPMFGAKSQPLRCRYKVQRLSDADAVAIKATLLPPAKGGQSAAANNALAKSKDGKVNGAKGTATAGGSGTPQPCQRCKEHDAAKFKAQQEARRAEERAAAVQTAKDKAEAEAERQRKVCRGRLLRMRAGAWQLPLSPRCAACARSACACMHWRCVLRLLFHQ